MAPMQHLVLGKEFLLHLTTIYENSLQAAATVHCLHGIDSEDPEIRNEVSRNRKKKVKETSNQDIFFQMEIFLLQLKHRKVAFSAGGFFELKTSLLCKVSFIKYSSFLFSLSKSDRYENFTAARGAVVILPASLSNLD